MIVRGRRTRRVHLPRKKMKEHGEETVGWSASGAPPPPSLLLLLLAAAGAGRRYKEHYVQRRKTKWEQDTRRCLDEWGRWGWCSGRPQKKRNNGARGAVVEEPKRRVGNARLRNRARGELRERADASYGRNEPCENYTLHNVQSSRASLSSVRVLRIHFSISTSKLTSTKGPSHCAKRVNNKALYNSRFGKQLCNSFRENQYFAECHCVE